MGYIAGLVPAARAASTCQVDTQGATYRSHPRCGSGPIISITSDEDRRLSLGLRRKESSEPRVNFSLPSRECLLYTIHWSNSFHWRIFYLNFVIDQNAERGASTSSSREKIRGSPRFPHRIVPAASLSTIVPGVNPPPHAHRWHSMEIASKPRIITPRGSSCSAGADVAAAIPLTELARSARRGSNKPPDTLPLAIPIDYSGISPDDRLAKDLRKLFREECNLEDFTSPIDTDGKYVRSGSSSSSTVSLRAVQSQRIVVGCQDIPAIHESARPQSPKVIISNIDSPISEFAEFESRSTPKGEQEREPSFF